MQIDFNENGTISIPIAGKTYTLKRPTVAQLAEFDDLQQQLRSDALDQIREWGEALENADDDETEEIRQQMGDRFYGLRAINEPWLRKAFEALGSDSLPDSLMEGPSELVSADLLPEIIRFWQRVPLARSPRR